MQQKHMAAIAAVLVVALAGGGVWWGLSRGKPGSFPAVTTPAAPGPDGRTLELPSGQPEVTLTPTRADAAGLDPQTAFTLTSASSLTVDQVKSSLTIQPALPLKVERADSAGRQFRVVPEKVLEAGKVYRVRLAPAASISRVHQWSFQTKGTFQVLGSLPRNEGTHVPVNTGIEISFSHEQYGDVAPFFDISPKVEGRFERHKKTVAFVPKEPLQFGTLYTVTLKAGLALSGSDSKLSSDYVFAFETQPPGGQSPKEVYFQTPGDGQEFPTSVAPFFTVWYNKQGEPNPKVDVKTYRYRDAAQYISALKETQKVPWWAGYLRSQQKEDVSGLTQVNSFTADLKQFPDYGGTYLLYPEAIPQGFYLAEFRVGDMARYARFQVTNLSSYTAVTSTRTLVWVNDLEAKAPVSGVRVEIPGGVSSATDADGVAVLPTPEGYGKSRGSHDLFFHLLAQPAPGSASPREAVIPVSFTQYNPTERKSLLYWKYLYLDRPIYKPEDKISLWGILSPREPSAEPVKAVTAEIIRNDYRYGSSVAPLAATALKVEGGTFTGSLPLSNLKPGWYEARVRLGEEVLITRYFEIMTYTKPAYRIELSANKQAVFVGEPVDVRLKASFFEGTPVPRFVANVSLGWNWRAWGTTPVTTDGAGEASYTVVPKASDFTDTKWGGPHTMYIRANPERTETYEVAAQTDVAVFTSNVTVAPEVKVENGRAMVTGQVNRVDLSRWNAGEPGQYKGPGAPGIQVEGHFIEYITIREEDGEYYDFIQKTVFKKYKYRWEQRIFGAFTATTDAQGRFTHQGPAVEPDRSYSAVLRVTDTKGAVTSHDIWFYGSQTNPAWYSYRYRWFHLQADKNQYALGEEARLELKENGKAIEDRSRSYLFLTSRMGLQEHRVQDSSQFQMRLKESDLPNTNVRAVYFDGRMYREAYDWSVRFNPAQREVTVTITPDKESYRPGETAKVNLQVTDRQGRPVQGQVNLSLVDEAIFAIREHRADILQQLYGEYIPSGILRTRSSHNMPEPGSGAEKGGDGGGPSVRRDFPDTAYFASLATGPDGKATASIKLPDSLTSWRLTYHALVPGRMQAASGTANLPVKLPFFAEMSLGETYLAGDSPMVTLRTYGTGLKDGDRVEFLLTVTDPGGKRTERRIEHTAYSPFRHTLETAQPGTYTVLVTANGPGGLADALEKKYTVFDTYLRRTKTDFHLLTPETRVTGADKGLTALTFSDYARSQYLRALYSLHWQWGNRFEQKLARMLAADLLKEHFDFVNWIYRQEVNLTEYQAPDGSMAILPYADGDLLLSALTADLAADRIDRFALRSYFQRILDDRGTGRDRAVIAMYGLAALDEPVLRDLRLLLQQGDLTLPETLYAALALAKLGDLEGARPVYYRVLKEHAEELGGQFRIKTGKDQDEILANTALVAALGGKLGEPYTPGFLSYLQENPTKEILLLLEQMIAVRAALPQASSTPASFTYVLDGKEHKEELKAGHSLRLDLTPERLATLQIKGVQGSVGLTAAYEVPITSANLQQETGFSLSRAYWVNGPWTGAKLMPGDLVRVTLTYSIPETAPGGAYEVTDYLPSGLRYLPSPWNYGKVDLGGRNYPAYPLEINGQKLTFWAWKDGGPITYYARVASPGDYTAEHPTLQFQKTGQIYGYDQRMKVGIQP